MKNLTAVFFAILSASPAALALDPAQQAACARLVKVYNRCGPLMEHSAARNEVHFRALGRSTPCDDGLNLPFEERLKRPDVASMLSQRYPVGKAVWPNRKLNDSPGGIRNDDFAKAVYGANESEVRRNLVTVNFLGYDVPFNRRNGAARAFANISRDLMDLYRRNADPKLTAFLTPFLTGECKPAERCRIKGSTFAWRFVAGTRNLSNHSFATAIDMQPDGGPEYWLWDVQSLIKHGRAKFRPGTDLAQPTVRDVIDFSPTAPHRIPEKLVEVFEKHGFIWGGKWYRYDVMHFEFRPEFFPGRTFPCD